MAAPLRATRGARNQAKNRDGLYDALRTLADTQGSELAREEYLPMIMEPLLIKWHEATDDDGELFPLFEVRGVPTRA